MFNYLLKLFLKLSRRTRLIPFVEGLANLGRPSAVLFPVELLEQGAGLLLSGLNNTLAIQSNLDWVWPHWLERQQNPDAREFVPTGVNLMTANLSMRNWTSLGVLGSDRESMLDPVGMLTLAPFGWSVFPYIRMNGTDYFPPRMEREDVVQSLKEGILPVIITAYRVHPELGWHSETRAIRVKDEELVAFDHWLENRGETPLCFTLGLSVRPYNSLTVGHINKLKYKNRLWRVNRRPGLLLAEDPARVAVSDRTSGDPLLASDWQMFGEVGVSKAGILAGIAEYDLVLAPGERRRVTSYGFMHVDPARLNPPPLSRPRFHAPFSEITVAALDEVTVVDDQAWHAMAHEGLRLSLPDPRLNTAFYAVKNHLHAFDDQQHFSPGTFFYHEHWFRDSAFIARAFHDVGFADRVKPKIADYIKRQNTDGFFRSQNGEWDSTGQAMVTIVDHIQRTGDRAVLEDAYSGIIRGARWIENASRRTASVNTAHRGLLPAGFSAEHFGPNDHYFWDNFWSLAGLERAAWAAQALHRDRDARRLAEVADHFHQCLREAMSHAVRREERSGLPCSPYRTLDSAAIGNLIAISPLNLVAPDEPWVRPTVQFLMDNNLRGGLFFQKIIHTGLNAYLSVQLAKTLLALDDPRWEAMLHALMEAASPTFTWPEAINPKTGGGCMGDGDHGWAAAEFCCLIRDMFVREQSGQLHLAAGLPKHWLKPGLDLNVEGASSPFGTIDYRLRHDGKQLLFTWEWTVDPLQPESNCFLLLPLGIDVANSTSRPHSRRKHKLPLRDRRGSFQLLIDNQIFRPDQPDVDPSRFPLGVTND